MEPAAVPYPQVDPGGPFLTRLVAVAARTTQATAAVLWLTDGSHWTSGAPVPGHGNDEVEAAGQALCSRVVRSGSGVVPDVAVDAPAGVAAWAGFPVYGAQGQVLGALVITDTSPRTWTADDVEALEVLARAASAELSWNEVVAQARDRSRRLTFLADASALLSSLPDSAGLPARLTRFCVPAVAEAALIDRFDGDQLVRVGTAHHDPLRQAALEALPALEVEPAAPTCSVGGGRVTRVMASGDVDVAPLEDGDPLAAALDVADAHPWVITAALRAGGRTLGLLTWVATLGEVYSADDVALARDFASRAAQAWERAQVLDERTAVAATLQASLLPAQLPEVVGMELASRYVAADAAVEVGGDFYDVFPATDGHWVAVMGDVTGRGVEAAGMTGLARHTLRALGRGTAPARSLAALNAVLCEAAEDERFATVACVRFRPGAAGGLDAPTSSGAITTMTFASGGHCSPVLVRADGTAELLDVPGTVLGLFQDVELVDVEARLEPGDAVVLYTDGVIEARRGGELFGEERLLQVLAQAPTSSAEELASRVLAAVDSFRTQGADDDLAILVLRAVPVPIRSEPIRSEPIRSEPSLQSPRAGQLTAPALPRALAGAQQRGRDAVFSEQAVARLTASSPEQLSAWADRYGLVVPALTRRGASVYTGDQLTALRTVRRQLDDGADEAQAHAVLAAVLAAAASTMPLPADRPADLPTSLLGGRVVLVDRDPHLLTLLAETLSVAGTQVVMAATTAQALEHLRQGPVGAAAVEMLLAGESGLDLAAQLVAQQVPVLLMSSLRAVDEAFVAGASAFLPKPLDADALTRALADLMT